MGDKTVNCYQCATAGGQNEAVAICPHCGAGMCIRHLREEQARPGPGGTRIGCGHGLRAASADRR